MPLKNSAIIIIAYNEPNLIVRQIELIKKYCQDAFDLIIVDNSFKQEAIDGIKYHAERNGCIYLKTDASSQNGSGSHAFSANFAYQKFVHDYEYFFYLDHDCFPTRKFSIVQTLGKKMMAGIAQSKSKTYLWPGCFMFKRQEGIDFSPLPGLDTGGSLYKRMEQIGLDKILFFSENHIQNRYFDKTMYNFYALIHEGTFLHFINGSNWNDKGAHEERINSLFNILLEKCE